MARNKNVSKEVIERIKGMNTLGYKPEYIAKKLNIGISTAYKYIDNTLQNQKKWSKEDISKLFELKKQGKEFRHIGLMLGRSKDQCCTRYHYYKDKF